MGPTIDIIFEHDAWTSIADIEGLAKRAVDAAMVEAATETTDAVELSLVLCDDAFMRDLNRNWRGKDKPTNVLSFPADPSARAMTLGDIIISYDTASREAADEGKRLADHLAHLLVHGTLHLLGYDHDTDSEGDAMERLETRALMRLGIASPYEDGALQRTSP